MKQILALILVTSTAFAQKETTKPNNYINIDGKKTERVVGLIGEVSEFSANHVIDTLKTLDKAENAQIYLIIDSPGGSVIDGYRIINQMKNTKSPLTCVVDMQAYSMAAIMLTYCKAVFMNPYGSIMHHSASFQISGSTEQVVSRVNWIVKQLTEFDEEVAKNLNMTYAEYKAKTVKEWWLTAKEALEAKVVDRLLPSLDYSYSMPEEANILELLFGGRGGRREVGLDVIK